MKKIKKLMVIVLSALMVIGACAVLTACPPPAPEGHDYTITIYDVDGTPCTWVTGVQACKVSEDGGLAVCYTALGQVDENGVAYLDCGSDIYTQLPEEATYIEIHLFGLPDYLTFDTTKMHKGDSATINLRYKTDAELDQASSGDGTGEYIVNSNTIDNATFSPYAVANASEYRLKFTSSDQKIYFVLTAPLAQNYKAYVVGGLNVKITQLCGNITEGVYIGENTQMTARGENCVYNFNADFANQVFYFEVSLEDAADVNVDGIICFAYNA
ncbi:MAG: hypothetical protein IKC35_03760 [Clostridia bacterium]|nr:hypothetical protein [Clostridia bacterium]